MSTKLTLRIDEELIQAAKEYADRRGTSVSKVVSHFFELLSREAEPHLAGQSGDLTTTDLPPVTASLWGLLEGKEVDVEDYRRYLEEKHL